MLPDYMTYTDQDGNTYELVYHPYEVGKSACSGCAFKFGNSKACRAAKSCTPVDANRARLVPAGYLWVEKIKP